MGDFFSPNWIEITSSGPWKKRDSPFASRSVGNKNDAISNTQKKRDFNNKKRVYSKSPLIGKSKWNILEKVYYDHSTLLPQLFATSSVGSTVWNVSKYRAFSGPWFPHSDWIPRDTKYLSVFSPNAGKYGPEKTPYLETFHTVLLTDTVLSELVWSTYNCSNLTQIFWNFIEWKWYRNLFNYESGVDTTTHSKYNSFKIPRKWTIYHWKACRCRREEYACMQNVVNVNCRFYIFLMGKGLVVNISWILM